MDKKESETITTTTSTFPKHIPGWLLLIAGFLLCALIAIPVSFIIYQSGYMHGKQVQIPSLATESNSSKKELSSKPKNNEDSNDNAASQDQLANYILVYTTPTGWRNMVWQPAPNTIGSALVSPDYTSIADPNPQTGISILIYEFPQHINDMTDLRPVVEDIEEGLTSLKQTTVAGFPAYHTLYDDSDSDRILEDYDILKGHDHWIVRIDFPNDSLPAMQTEEQKYTYAINALLQSIQFKTIQYH